MAHAENGDYEDAVQTIERAIKLAPSVYQEELRHALELFQQRKPFRLGPDPEELFYPFFESADH